MLSVYAVHLKTTTTLRTPPMTLSLTVNHLSNARIPRTCKSVQMRHVDVCVKKTQQCRHTSAVNAVRINTVCREPHGNHRTLANEFGSGEMIITAASSAYRNDSVRDLDLMVWRSLHQRVRRSAGMRCRIGVHKTKIKQTETHH